MGGGPLRTPQFQGVRGERSPETGAASPCVVSVLVGGPGGGLLGELWASPVSKQSLLCGSQEWPKSPGLGGGRKLTFWPIVA